MTYVLSMDDWAKLVDERRRGLMVWNVVRATLLDLVAAALGILYTKLIFDLDFFDLRRLLFFIYHNFLLVLAPSLYLWMVLRFAARVWVLAVWQIPALRPLRSGFVHTLCWRVCDEYSRSTSLVALLLLTPIVGSLSTTFWSQIHELGISGSTLMSAGIVACVLTSLSLIYWLERRFWSEDVALRVFIPPTLGTLGAIAIVLLYLGLLCVPSVLRWETYETDIQHPKAIELHDGSRLWLSKGSAVKMRYGPFERKLELIHGQVTVQVAPDSSRSLVLTAGPFDYQAQGDSPPTDFTVRRVDADGSVHLFVRNKYVELETQAKFWPDEDLFGQTDAGYRLQLWLDGTQYRSKKTYLGHAEMARRWALISSAQQ